MASLDSVRIALKSMSRMSLNERFQLLRQKQVRQQTIASNSNKSAQNASRLELRQGSQKNRRLALQMANRPSVLAALRANNRNPPMTNRPIKQRLGINNSRNNNKAIAGNSYRNQNRPVFQPNRNFNANPNFNRNFNRNVNNRTNATAIQINRRKAITNNQNIGVIVGVRRKGLQRNRLQRNGKPTPNPGLKGKRKVGQQIRNQNQAKAPIRRGFRINRNFSARNNPGKALKRRNLKPNKEQLDKDLDAYMAGTKSHLDAEIDAYMSQTN